MSKQKATMILEHLKTTNQFYCFTAYNEVYSAQDLLTIIKDKPVSMDETIEFLTDK